MKNASIRMTRENEMESRGRRAGGLHRHTTLSPKVGIICKKKGGCTMRRESRAGIDLTVTALE
jgi:hypothetical protein